MIFDEIKNLERYKGMSKNLDTAIDFLLSDRANRIEGEVELDGRNVYVSRQIRRQVPEKECLWENHHDYIDIHACVAGVERIGYCNHADTFNWSEDNGKDCVFSEDPVKADIADVAAGSCLILWPNEPHKPSIGEGSCEKLIVKIHI